jgi:hypothetical protein
VTRVTGSAALAAATVTIANPTLTVILRSMIVSRLTHFFAAAYIRRLESDVVLDPANGQMVSASSMRWSQNAYGNNAFCFHRRCFQTKDNPNAS